MKVIANYLPQFHRIPENDKWWGEGFTDWKSAQDAKPLFNGHCQPRVPKDNFYYDLSKKEDIEWQVNLANKHGVYGFGIYHYWFNNDMKLLETPSEIIRDNPEIDTHYMFIWDNTSWTRTWTNKRFANNWVIQEKSDVEDQTDNGMLAELIYGEEDDWANHFNYLLTFFKDERYIKIDNKPVFAIFNQNNQPDVLRKMVLHWDKLAKENGFAGIYVLGKKNYQNINISDYQVNYEPAQSALQPDNIVKKVYFKLREKFNKNRRPNYYNYDSVWKSIIKKAKNNLNPNEFYSAFVDFDDSPRRGINGRIMKGATPEKFEKYFEELLKVSKEQNREYVFLTAWNEWGEGAYLEPDELNGSAYLEAVERCVKKVD